jgi:hypothetical protein
VTPEALAEAARECSTVLLREYHKTPAGIENKESVRVFVLDPRVDLWDLVDNGKSVSDHPYLLGLVGGSSAKPLEKVGAGEVEAFFKPLGGKL